MPRISADRFRAMVNDVSVPDREIGELLIRSPDDNNRGKLRDITLVPDPDKVEVEPGKENALAIGNGISRSRRQRRFRLALNAGDKRPVLVSEGDSWFQFPFLIEDVIDHLGSDHLIWSLDAAGDTAENMLGMNSEYIEGLRLWKDRPVRAFLLSAAGNDVIGADPAGVSMLSRLLRNHQPGQPARAQIDEAMLASVMGDLESRYRETIVKVRAEPGLPNLPILIHGYDHALPSGFTGDRRRPIYADRDQWLGAPLRAHGIDKPELREAVIRELIDELYAMLQRVAGDPDQTKVYLVDARDAIHRDQWNDEIHGTDDGFAAVAARFRTVLRSVLTT
jgi:hypothetical protein